MADVQLALIDQENTQIALAAPTETSVNIAVPGIQGIPGPGMPSGGASNQVLFKQSSTNYDTAWGNVTSAMIGDLQIADADVSASAAIAGTKISPNFGSQNISTTGSIAVGTPSPSLPLDVVGGIRSRSGTIDARLQAGYSGAVGIGAESNDAVLFIQNATERARIDSFGRLLVGTPSSITEQFSGQARLQSVTAGNYAFSAFNYTADAGECVVSLCKSRSSNIGHTIVQSGDSIGGIRFQGSDGTGFLSAAWIKAEVDGTPGADDMPGRLVFSTTADGASSPTERMRIANNGHTYVVTTGNAFALSTTLGAGTTNYLLKGFYSATAGAVESGTQSIIAYTNGNIVNTNNSYGAISDIKLKENIVDANSQWDDIKSLQVRNYNFKEGQTHTQIGLVAQEAELVSPGLVSESPDRDADGNDLGTVTKSVNYSVLYMKAVKALQEAMERIETLEAKVAALEAA